MRKAGLLTKKPLSATAKMLAEAKKDTGTVKRAVFIYNASRQYTEYKTRYYFRAAPATEGILEVDLFTRKDLAEGKKEPRFRIFLDYEKEDFETWDTINQKWSRAKIDMLDSGDNRYTYSYRGRNYAAENTKKLVNRCLGTGNMPDVEAVVLEFQLRVRENDLKSRHRLVTDMIDGYMDTVPEKLPAEWMRFLNRKALEKGHCIIYDGISGTGYCTCCRLHVRVPDTARHNMPGKCTCGSRITYKRWKMQQHIEYKTKASLIQKCTDGRHFVHRQFNVTMWADRKNEYIPEIKFHENYRKMFIVTEGRGPLHVTGSYEWGTFKKTGVERWCEEYTVNHGGYCYGYCYGYAEVYARSVLYTPNLKRIFRGTNLQYVPAAEIIKGMADRINVMAVLGDMRMSFPYEAFWKIGLKRFVQDRVRRDGTEGMTRMEHNAGKPWQYLKITKEDMMQAARIDATDQQMRIIQRAAELNVKLTDEQILWLDENVGVSVLMKYFPIHTPHRIIRYMKENVGVPKDSEDGKEKLHFWTDYLDTSEQLHWDLSDRAVFFPQKIKRAHDEAVNVFMIQKDKEKAEALKAKDMVMHGYAREIKKAFCYRDGQYAIKVPGRYLDFKKEGNEQNNCVATYYEKVLNGECIVLFIRKRKEPDKPFCTVEIRNSGGKFQIRQNETKYHKPAPQEARKFLKTAVKAAQRIADQMMKEEKVEICIKTAV